jgi:hypothetical protein
MTRNGVVFLRRRLELPTGENGLSLWPTPTARDHKDSGENVNYEKLAKKSRLSGTVVMEHRRNWPTPTARLGTSRGPQAKRYKDPKRSNDLDDAVVYYEDQLPLGTIAGNGIPPTSLNPAWVEWLMGYPIGWTEYDPWATVSSPRSSSMLEDL